MITLLRSPSDPVDTYTTSESESATRIAPIDPVPMYPSETLCQLWPLSVVFQTPPPVAPM